jgi:hypothetical protein
MAATAQLRLGFKNDRDMLARFGVELVSALEVDGVSIPEKLGAKERVFTFPVDAAELRLKVSIDAVDATGGAAKSAATLKVEQKLLINLNQPKPHFRPAGPAPFVDKLDPRLSVSALHQGGVVLQVTLDLLCVDVTEHARLHGLAGIVDYDANPGHFTGTLGPHYGCELRVVELATAPRTWYVVVPPKARTAAAPGVLVFYRPRGAAYADSDVALGSLAGGFLRYVQDPPKGAPWHVTLPTINEFPPCGLERQVGECDKPVIFVFPMPDAAGFGNASGANLLPHLDAVLRTLATTTSTKGGTVLGNGLTAPLRRGRLGLAGFSFGGAACLTTFKAISGSVDELYLCDPANLKGSEGVSSWWQGANKRLGLLGGFFFHGTFRGLARQLEKAREQNPKLTSEVHLFPRDAAAAGAPTVDGFEGSLTYPTALAPGGIVNRFQDQFEREADGTPKLDANKKKILTPAPPPDSLSALSGVFFVRFTESGGFTNTVIGGRDAAGKPFEVEVQRASHVELAARALLLWRVKTGAPPPAPLVTLGALAEWGRRDLLQLADGRAGVLGTIRHQWPVVGGEGSPDRGAGFKGYLQLCLEKSAF